MAKFSGKIGYMKPVEVEPGIWDEECIERPAFGDVIRNQSRYQSSGGINDDIVINSSISIIADPFANENFQHMKYVVFMGTKWQITNADCQYPRIILNLGGVYNGK